MADATYGPKVYHKQGGDELVVASGGTINIESGGMFVVDGAQLASADQAAAVAASGGDSPTEAEFNAVVTLVNRLRADLVSAGIIKGEA